MVVADPRAPSVQDEDEAALPDVPDVPAIPLPPGLPRVRPGSVSDAKALRSQLLRLVGDVYRGGQVLDLLVAQARAKAIYLVLDGPDGAPFESWEAFCTAARPWGLGLPAALLDAVVAEARDIRALARRVLLGPVLLAPHGLTRAAQARERGLTGETDETGETTPALGHAPLVDPRTGKVRKGASTIYLLHRLRRDRPDVLLRVAEGALTLTVARKLAGIVSRQVTVTANPEAFARAITAHLSESERAELLVLLRHPERIPPAASRRYAWQRRRDGETAKARAQREAREAAALARRRERNRASAAASKARARDVQVAVLAPVGG
jgi:hypothetical protein